MKKKSKTPKSLKADAKIDVVASSSPFDRDAFLDGVLALEKSGFVIRYNDSIFKKEPYLAGSDKRRAGELIDAIKNQSSDAILFARGGYGSMRLLPFLDRIKPIKPKIMMGYSDITSLLLYAKQKWGWVVFYGPVVAKEFTTKRGDKNLKFFKNYFTSDSAYGSHVFKELKIIKSGTVKAPLTGGCLSLVTASLGTPYEINADNHILFLEDTNEKPYEIDRLLMQLKLAGKFKKCRGIIFGTLNGPNPTSHYEAAIKSVLGDVKFPIVMNFPCGHLQNKFVLPFGVPVQLNTKTKSLKFLQPALS